MTLEKTRFGSSFWIASSSKPSETPNPWDGTVVRSRPASFGAVGNAPAVAEHRGRVFATGARCEGQVVGGGEAPDAVPLHDEAELRGVVGCVIVTTP